jgi:hypothetical protein
VESTSAAENFFGDLELRNNPMRYNFSVAQSKILQDNLFITLLKQLGFHFHEGKLAIFPRIPSMWGPEKLYRMGLFLSSRSPKKFSAADVDSTERSLEKRLLGF